MAEQRYSTGRIQLPPGLEGFNKVGSVFRIGKADRTLDLIQDNVRVLLWQPTREDSRLALAAGWEGRIKHSLVHAPYQAIGIPMGSRSAESILGGVEAWDDEKLEFINFIGGYSRAVREMTGKTDVSVSLETVARTAEGEFFITPPHMLTDNAHKITEWQRKLALDIDTVMMAEESPRSAHELAQRFIKLTSLPDMPGHGVRQ